MGINVIPGGGGGGGGSPGGGGGGGNPPRKFRKKDTCKQAPKAKFVSELTDEEIKKLVEEYGWLFPDEDGLFPHDRFLKAFMPGAENPVFEVWTNQGFMGDEPYQDYPGRGVVNSEGEPEAGPFGQPEGGQYGGSELKDGFKGAYVPDWKKDGEYEAEKSKIKQKGKRKKIEVTGTDKKNKALKKKVNKEIKNKPLGDAVEELVGEELEGINTDRVDKEEMNKIIVDRMTINEDFLNVAINRLAALGGAEWHISSNDDFWFYRPENRINSQPITTEFGVRLGANADVLLNPADVTEGLPPETAKGSSPGFKFQGTERIEPNVKKDTAEVEADGSAIKNRIQVSGGKEPTEKKEVIPLPKPDGEPIPEDYQPDEIHLTYPPIDMSIRGPRWDVDAPTIAIKYYDGTPNLELPLFLDWTGRTGTDLYSPTQQLSGPSPEGLFAPPIVAFFNFHEKAIRFGENPLNYEVPPNAPRPNPPGLPDWSLVTAPGSTNVYFEVEYTYARPVYFTMSDPDSIEKYGVQEFRLVSPGGHSAQELRAMGKTILRDWSQPRVSLSVTVFEDSWELGQTAKVMIPELGLLKEGGAPYLMPVYEREKIYDIARKHTRWPGEINLKLGKKPMSFDVYMAQYMENRVKALEETAFNRENPLEELQYEQKILGFKEYVATNIITVSTGEIDVAEIDVNDIT